ncbi:hypothetical protein CLF_100407 [Clonorchis sinensis]|uniref:Uncharacterized protein n=1 Tax=Clonorchis sinensis TaxID=79923 RepID=G7Y3D5_CLOSI|nr:hypothetical protein CLF_100407 [Clonorchis sinensis]
MTGGFGVQQPAKQSNITAYTTTVSSHLIKSNLKSFDCPRCQTAYDHKLKPSSSATREMLLRLRGLTPMRSSRRPDRLLAQLKDLFQTENHVVWDKVVRRTQYTFFTKTIGFGDSYVILQQLQKNRIDLTTQNHIRMGEEIIGFQYSD